jgi:CHAT domain-containing protein
LHALVKASVRAALQANLSSGVSTDAFEWAQWAQSLGNAKGNDQLARRRIGNDSRAARLLREREDLSTERERNNPSSGRLDPSRNSLLSIDTRIAEIDAAIAKDYPEYEALRSSKVLSISEVRPLLGEDEALVLILDTPAFLQSPEETFVWLVTKADTRLLHTHVGTNRLQSFVEALQCGLDPSCKSGSRKDRFPLEVASALYDALLRPAHDLLGGKRLLFVSTEFLARLPFQVLLTEPPDRAITGAYAYQRASWLGAQNPISILPSVGSLQALRAFARGSEADLPYIGFGDPQVGNYAGHDGCNTPVRYRTAPKNVEVLERLGPLPDTADEICQTAVLTNADPQRSAYLGPRATKDVLMALSASGELARARIVHFATRSDDDPSAGQRLHLTLPPDAPNVRDAFLTAADVATLKLDADWVILSVGASSGVFWALPRSFFYAGARAVLIPYFNTQTSNMIRLITSAFRE